MANDNESDAAFYVVLFLVFAITVGSLVVGLWKSTERKLYSETSFSELRAAIPIGNPTPSQIQQFDDLKKHVDDESKNQDTIITILLSVFQAGTGAILGLLTGKATSK